jgi:hypothetical protein
MPFQKNAENNNFILDVKLDKDVLAGYPKTQMKKVDLMSKYGFLQS